MLNIISMTELQKLSLKKLRKKELPLYVIDRKSKKGGFVIVDYKSYEDQGVQTPPQGKVPLELFDFQKKGLFWDHPNFSNERFRKILRDPHNPEFRWAATRILERLRSDEVLKLFTLDDVRTLVHSSYARDFVKKPWEHALAYYDQKPQRHR